MPEQTEESPAAETPIEEVLPVETPAVDQTVIDDFSKLEPGVIPEAQPTEPKLPPPAFTVQPTPDIERYVVEFEGLGANPPVRLIATTVLRFIRTSDGACIATQPWKEVVVTDAEFRAFPQYDALRDYIRATIVSKL